MQAQAQYILVGDNVNKNIAPRDRRVDNQMTLLHYFHSYATYDWVSSSHLSNEGTVEDIASLPLSKFAPFLEDCQALQKDYCC